MSAVQHCAHTYNAGQRRVLSYQVINSKQHNLGLTQESLRMVTARVLVVLSGSFTSQIETGPTIT